MPFNEDFLDKIGKAEVPQNPDSDEIDSDRDYSIALKKHRLLIQKLDNLYKVITHPTCIFISITILMGIFLTMRYVGIYTGNEFLLSVSKDIGSILTYVFAALVSHIFTKLIEGRKM